MWSQVEGLNIVKVWLVGADGQLGKSIAARYVDDSVMFGSWFSLLSTTKAEVDIVDAGSVSRFIAKCSPDIIVNAAAYTDVESAENETTQCRQVNVVGVVNLATVAAKLAIPLIHISTDYVFDGQSSKPYIETDQTNALNVYGQSKCEGEERVRQILEQHLILRTSWLISPFGRNFANTIMGLSKQNTSLKIIADQFGSPTYADDLAMTICQLIIAIGRGESDWGTFHYCGDTAMSWYELTNSILDEVAAQDKLVSKPDVLAIASKDYAAKAIRPKYSVLNCQKITDIWGILAPDWQNSLKRLVRKL